LIRSGDFSHRRERSAGGLLIGLAGRFPLISSLLMEHGTMQIKLHWHPDGDGLILRGIRPSPRVLPDATYPTMHRIHFRGWVSDMVNLSRAKDAAREMAEQILARRAFRLIGAPTIAPTPSNAASGQWVENAL